MEALNQSVAELGASLQRFGAADYAVFALMLLLCAAIGVYYGFCAGDVSQDDYLVGGRSMRTFPIALSLIASFISGITLLGTPTEVYLYGTQYTCIGIAVIMTAIFTSYTYLPVFHDLRLTSTYEYLELRFSKQTRIFGSFLFVVGVIAWVPIVIYVPALAFNQVTGVNVHIVTPMVCLVCIFYTCVGGLKAVVWTDVVQTFMMFGSMILVIIKGSLDIGGFGVVWERNWNSGRIEGPSLSTDPTERHSLMVIMIGGFIHWMTTAVQQIMMQRYLALPTLRHARGALAIFALGALLLIAICSYGGLLIYATYFGCDPLTTKLAKAKDQLMPLLVMQTLGDLPGLPGVFVAGVFSAALSSMSTALNSTAAVVLEDFWKMFCRRPLSPRQTDFLMKGCVVVMGVICVLLVFVVEKLGAVLQLSMSLGAVTTGPALGLFTVGMFLPFVGAKAALSGCALALAVMTWIVLGAQAAIATGALRYEVKPLSVHSCPYNYVNATADPTLVLPPANDVFPLFRMSYLWYALLGASSTVVASCLVSLVLGKRDPSKKDPALFIPFIRKYLPDDKAKTYKAVDLQIVTKDSEQEKMKTEKC